MAIHWIELQNETQWSELLQNSYLKPQYLFKHSYRCSISTLAKGRLDRSNENVNVYLLDVVTDRPLSQKIARDLGVIHESPQLITINMGQAINHSSHNAIHSEMLMSNANP